MYYWIVNCIVYCVTFRHSLQAQPSGRFGVACVGGNPARRGTEVPQGPAQPIFQISLAQRSLFFGVFFNIGVQRLQSSFKREQRNIMSWCLILAILWAGLVKLLAQHAVCFCGTNLCPLGQVVNAVNYTMLVIGCGFMFRPLFVSTCGRSIY